LSFIGVTAKGQVAFQNAFVKKTGGYFWNIFYLILPLLRTLVGHPIDQIFKHIFNMGPNLASNHSET